MKTMMTQKGFTLVELMVSLTVASLLSIAVISSFAAQNSVYVKQAQRMQSNDDGRQSFEVLSRLFRHAEAGSVNITDTDDTDGLSTLVSFSLPTGFPVWPNINGPFTDNFIFIKWANHSVGDNVAYQIRMANSDTNATPAESDFMVLSGANSGRNTRITGFSLAKQPDNINYKMTVIARNGIAENSSETFFDGFILPRN